MTGPSEKSLAISRKPGPLEVVAMLTEGNWRFRHDQALHPNSSRERRELAANADQAEHAIVSVLSCADSRVPVERIFDAGVMDLFVVRVAGNVVSPVTAASLEYGALHVHTPLVLILGHTGCGAVTAALALKEAGEQDAEGTIVGLLERIEPCLDRAQEACALDGDAVLLDTAVEENVWQSIAELGRLSPAVGRACAQGRLVVAGAIYDLHSGRVRWLDLQRATELVSGRASQAV